MTTRPIEPNLVVLMMMLILSWPECKMQRHVLVVRQLGSLTRFALHCGGYVACPIVELANEHVFDRAALDVDRHGHIRLRLEGKQAQYLFPAQIPLCEVYDVNVMTRSVRNDHPRVLTVHNLQDWETMDAVRVCFFNKSHSM